MSREANARIDASVSKAARQSPSCDVEGELDPISPRTAPELPLTAAEKPVSMLENRTSVVAKLHNFNILGAI